MNDNYKDFIKDGPIKYVGKVDSVKVLNGWNRIQINWQKSSDPEAKRLKIFWQFDGKRDSIEKRLDKKLLDSRGDSIIISGLNEGDYTFQIFVYDDLGNSSVVVETNGIVYGERFSNSLLPFMLEKATYLNGKLSIRWTNPKDTSYLGSKLVYRDVNDKVTELFIKEDVSSLDINNYKIATAVQIQSMYFPVNGVDTVYSKKERIPIIFEYLKSGWTTKSSGHDGERGPWLAIDNNTSTVWHMDKNLVYPHFITIDMNVIQTLSGFTFLQRTPLNGALIQAAIEVSKDGVSWTNLGEYAVGDIATLQFIALKEVVDCRFIKIICLADSKKSGFTAIAEVGVYNQW